MKLDKKDLLLYGVTDSHYLNGRKLCELVEEAILGGVTMIQIREKEMSHEEFKQEALEVQEVCQKYHVPLLINDDVKLCKEIDADGVHIGQDDLDLKETRKLLGEDKIIGVSAHNMKEVKAALIDLCSEWQEMHLSRAIVNDTYNFQTDPQNLSKVLTEFNDYCHNCIDKKSQ